MEKCNLRPGHLELGIAGRERCIMKRFAKIKTHLLHSAALLIALLTPAAVFAQGCSLCYSQAAAAGARVIQALRSGIVILVLPPMFICVAFAVMAYKKRNQFNEE